MAVTAVDIDSNFGNKNSAREGKTLDRNSGKLRPKPGWGLERITAPPPRRFFLRQAGTNHRQGVLSAADAAKHATLIESFYFSRYGNVKNDARWQHIYQRAQRNINFIDHANAPATRLMWSYPCHYCGIVLPEQLIEVDHRQPQAHPGVAILKCLHAVNGGYTLAAGGGTKVAQLGAISAAAGGVGVGALTRATPRFWDPLNVWHHGINAPVANLTKQQRYTITPLGETFLTILRMIWGEGGVERKCLDNLINLVPSCHKCNGSTGKGSNPHAHQ